MNSLKKRNIFIISFFVLTWTTLFLYGNKRFNELNNEKDQIVYFNEDLNLSIKTSLLESSSSNYNLSTDIDAKDNSVNDNLFRKVANAEGLGDSDSVVYKTFFDKQDYNDDDDDNYNLCGNFRCYTGEQFVDLYNNFENNLDLKKSKKHIYDGGEIDSYIINLAKERGYKERVFANSEDIIDYMSMKTRPEVKSAYIKMRDTMKKDGISLHFVSGYRSVDLQRNIFLRKLSGINKNKIPNGLYDNKINNVLEKSSIPGYSKHHSGYAVDFGCGNDYLVYSFADTDCYKWMSKNNFENIKRFGFIPSYPNVARKQGPNPEPWEFVWVGIDNIK